nr:unnamed protein product [Callosobruchus analis]
MRHPYHDKNDFFLEDNIEVKEPLDLFNKWFQVVKSDTRTVEPNAMCLSTCAKYVLFVFLLLIVILFYMPLLRYSESNNFSPFYFTTLH